MPAIFRVTILRNLLGELPTMDVSTAPFNEVGTKGMMFIEAWIRDRSAKMRDHLSRSATEQGEVLSDFLFSPMSVYERQWNHYAHLTTKYAKQKRDEVIEIGKAVTVLAVILPVLGWSASQEMIANLGASAPTLFFTFVAVFLLGAFASWFVLIFHYMKSRSMEFADIFAHGNELPMKMWGVSASSIYIGERDKAGEGFRCRRIPIQTITDCWSEITPLGRRLTLTEQDGKRHDLYDPVGLMGPATDNMLSLVASKNKQIFPVVD